MRSPTNRPLTEGRLSAAEGFGCNKVGRRCANSPARGIRYQGANAMNSATRKRRKPQRAIGLVERQGEWFLLEVTVGKQTDFYIGRQIPADFGVAFALEKQDAEGTAETYHVNLGGADSWPTCDCKGFCYHGHCKHAEGLLALRKTGRLSA